MANPHVERLERDLAEIVASYERSFAGQERHTRSPEKLGWLIERTRAVLARIGEAPGTGPELSALREAAAEQLRFYEGERTAIAEAVAAGPDFEGFAHLAARANLILSRYQRHFAGRPRATRDTGLLDEMLDELRELRREMEAIAARTSAPSFQHDLRLVSDNLVLYAREREEILNARARGTPDEQANALAGLANTQLQLYQAHFAGHSRQTRRRALLLRIIDTLEQARRRMLALRAGGLSADFNDRNIDVIARNLRVYRDELAEIGALQDRLSPGDLLGLLGGEANQVFESYQRDFGGHDRAAVDLPALGLLCDRLGEIARQMGEALRRGGGEEDRANLALMVDNLAAFEQEYEQIQRAQRKPPA